MMFDRRIRNERAERSSVQNEEGLGRSLEERLDGEGMVRTEML